MPLPRPVLADWQEQIYHEPQVRYLLAHLAFGGDPEIYRGYAVQEQDPDSREAIRLWDAGVRPMNQSAFELKWLAHPAGKEGKILRVVIRGSDRVILGSEVILTSDLGWYQSEMRLVIADLTLGANPATYAPRAADPSVTEALRRWHAGARCINPYLIAVSGEGGARRIVYRGTKTPIDPTCVGLTSDAPWSELNVRYFMIDVALGGSLEFYRIAAYRAHEMSCFEAVRRIEEGFRVTNAEDFERKKLNGKTVITLKGSDGRISGSLVKLSSDPDETPP